ncbi:MAG: AmmeMemoRadiSam system protein B [Deltaproteobacteria bacterium]|nr:AmmeMemoRadiSam system protein B [Deltaproteobacteria bacterium]
METDGIVPRLRSVDIFPSEMSGQKVICLRDPLNFSGKVLFVPYAAFFIIRFFDGQHSILDIQAEFMRQFGKLLYREDVQRLADQLNENYFLESDRFRKQEREMIASFKKTPIRPLTLAGESYGEDKADLEEAIMAYFQGPEGPGLPTSPPDEKNLSGAIAPHIDYRRGGHCYAFAHRAILESCAADLFIILGTAHTGMQEPFSLTDKDFQTPWGPVPTDRTFLEAMKAHCSNDFYGDEFVHKGEHSIELQLVFLTASRQRAGRREPKPLQIVPVLCGSFHEAILKDRSPMELPGVREFIQALRMTAADYPGKICFIASADLAHVGVRFGDAEPPTPFSLTLLAEEDRELLGYVERVDAEGFYDTVRKEKDRRRICGLSSIYTLLQVVRGKEGKLLKYAQAPEPHTQSVVTFASVAFYG